MEIYYQKFHEINYQDCKYKLIDENVPEFENTFTVVIGKNAIGKSSLLCYLIKHALRNSKKKQLELFDSESNVNFRKIIALSTTPFDKFPTERSKQNHDQKYKYLGYRSSKGPATKNSQLAKIINNLFLASRNNKSIFELNNTFKTLGYHPRIRVVYRSRLRGPFKDQYNSADDKVDFLENYFFKKHRYSYRKVNFTDQRLQKIIRSLNNLFGYYEKDFSMSLDIDFTNNIFIEGNYDLFDDLRILIEEDLVVYQDLKLYRDKFHEISINSTSSGERCLFINFLGIASVIENDSLICIDEPEISLHPEWQEKYMSLLMTAFSSYKGCQFVLATHSPQMVSNLVSKNCYILAMDSRKTYSNTNFSLKSTDYQLAKLFQTPGFNNEYLMTELLEILALLSEGASPTKSLVERVEYILQIKHTLKKNDPVRKLAETLQKVSEMINI